MKKKNMNEDKLMQIDFNAAYPNTPLCIHEALQQGKMDIERYERKKIAKRRRIAAIAAAFVLIIGITAIMEMRTGNKMEDAVTSPVLSENRIAMDMETVVFTSKEDPYYHRDQNCSLAGETNVEIPLITALEFEKRGCPDCGNAADMEMLKDVETDPEM